MLVQIDNTIAMSNINHLGRTVSPQATEIIKHVWMWYLERSISVKAQYSQETRTSGQTRNPE